MRFPLKLLLAVPTLALIPGAAFAQASDPDVRCLLISNAFASKETDAQRKQVAASAVSFYLGRIDIRLSPAQFRASVLQVGKEKISGDLGATMTACAKTVQLKQVATAKMVQEIARTQTPAAKAPAAKPKG